MESSLVSALVVLASSAVTALAVVLIAASLMRTPSRVPQAGLGGNRLDAVFLFSDSVLVDANDRGEALLASLAGAAGEAAGEGGAWARLSRYLAAGFPDLADQMATLARRRRLDLTASDGSGLALRAEWLDGTARLTVADTAAEEGGIMLDRLSHRALEEELAVLRRVSDLSPILTWRENAQGQVIWANGAYLHQLVEAGFGGAVSWPLPQLFATGEPGQTQRVSLTLPGARQAWFDLRREADEKGQLVFALPADAAHQAERTKRSFIQTLTKTFATLPIGLAVFDRHRRLQLFNPALTDLTGLEPEFLLSRPGMEGFLNRMRGKRVLPEPRDYANWARRLMEAERGGDSGEFEETWSLPSGQTFRVSIRPHPDGALAFMLEDISSEVYLSRNFRAELETGQAALNLLDAAIAVFAANGQMVLTNAAFARLWGIAGEDTLAVITLREALDVWRARCDDSEIWAQLTEIGQPRTGRISLAGDVRLNDGRAFTLRARRSSNGTLLCAFEPVAEPPALPSPQNHCATEPPAAEDRAARQPAEPNPRHADA
jgi:PAS domain-containing protein